MDYKYDELSYAEMIYNNGFQSKYMTTELKLVATYMKTVLDLKPKDRETALYKFAEENIEGYEKELYYQVIDKALRYAAKKDSLLIKVESVPIYQNEIDLINNVSIKLNENDYRYEYECKKVIFSFLVQLKFNYEIYKQRRQEENDKQSSIFFSGGNKKYKDIKKISKLDSKIDISKDIIYHLCQNGYITSMYNGLIRLNYIADLNEVIHEEDEKPAIIIKDCNIVGWYFDLYNGINNVSACETCNKPYKKSSNAQLYCCDECKPEYYESIGTKMILCVDCGKEVEINAKNNETCRCDQCKKEHSNKLASERMKKYRKRKKTSVTFTISE